MNQSYTVNAFNDLTLIHLYQILRLRSEVFVVEQNCPYLDIDNKDQKSYHLSYYVDGELAAYTRLLPAGISYNEISIGRVVTAPAYRGKGLGKQLMEASIAACDEKFGPSSIRIGAQYHLLKFYNSLGFIEEGQPYDEDGIPHIEMVKR